MSTPSLARASLALFLAMAILPGRAGAQEERETPSGLLPEPRVLKSAINFVAQMNSENGNARAGFYPELGHMITGAGWISAGPGYRHRVFSDRAVVDLSAALSWRAYKMAQARFEYPGLAGGHVALGSQVLWQDLTQVNYFGAGPESSEAALTDYRMQGSNVVAYATARSNRPVSVSGRIGWLTRRTLSSSTGPFDRNLPDTMLVFAQEPAAALVQQPPFFHADVSMVRDTRDRQGHPTRGGLYRAAWVGFTDRHDATYTFERYETEAAHFLPVVRGRWVLAARGLGVFSTTTAKRLVPFYLLPSLGGNNTLRGYADYRFHDRDLLVANVESRWALFTHLDGAAFFDAGNVAPRVRDLDLARTSYGAGVRLHTGVSTIARLDLARSHEGWRAIFRLNDPLRPARLSRRTAAVPFVP